MSVIARFATATDNLWIRYAMHLWQTIRTASVDRHIHAEAYASIVLSGAMGRQATTVDFTLALVP